VNEDREVVVVDEFYGAVLFVLEAGGVQIHLDQKNAGDLRDELNKFLGVDKQDAGRLEPASTWYVGQVIPKGSESPDMPVGSRVQDSSEYRDIAVKREDGLWEWIKVLGSLDVAKSSDPFNWSYFKDDFDWTILQVGK